MEIYIIDNHLNMRILEQMEGLLAVLTQVAALGELLQHLVQHLGGGGEHWGQPIVPTHLGHLGVDIDQGIQLLGLEQSFQKVYLLVIGQVVRLLERSDQF